MGSITVNRAELGKALDFASLGLSKRPVAPVMAGMLVTITPGTLELAAFDYETTARAKVSGEASGPGSALVSGAELAAVVKSLPKGRKVSAEVLVSDDGMVISCDGTESVISSLGEEAAKEYPAFPAMPELSGYVDGETFAATVARVTVCASRDGTLPVLTHVKIGSDGGTLELAATDRYRLGVDRVHWTGPDDVSALVPAAELAALGKKLGKSGKVSLHFGTHHTGFSDGAYSLIVRDLTGSHGPAAFPKYKSLARDESDDVTTVLADAAALEAAVTRAGKLAERGEPVHLGITGDGITVRVYRDGKPAGSQAVPAVLDGEPLEVRFHAPYLASVLAGVEGITQIGFAGASKPAVIRGGGFIAVVMPVRPPQA